MSFMYKMREIFWSTKRHSYKKEFQTLSKYFVYIAYAAIIVLFDTIISQMNDQN